MALIYVVEDDASILELVSYSLNNSGHEARGFESGEEFFKALEERLPELALLDIMLPGQDGMQILKKLRADPAFADIPVMMTTAKGAEYDKIMGLNLGADDYVTKPFGIGELIARINAVLRRSGRAGAGKKDVLNYKGIELRYSTHVVTVDGVRAELTLKEFGILALFLNNQGRVFTRDSLLEQVWGYNFEGGTRTVDVHIRSLRKKLSPYEGSVETVRGLGYRLESG